MDGARSHLILLGCADALTVILLAARWYLLRHRADRYRSEKVSNVLFVTSGILHLACVCTLLYKCASEITLRREHPEAREEKLKLKLLAPEWLRMLYWVGFLYVIELWVLKSAFIAFYWGLFRQVHTRLRVLLWVTILLNGATFVTIFTLYMSWCVPIQRNWTHNLLDYQACTFHPSRIAHTIHVSLNISTDVIILLLPLSIIRTLKLGSAEKFALAFVFSIGGFSIAAAAIRFGIILRALKGGYTSDTMRQLERWSVIEYSMALLAFCLPALRRQVVLWFGSVSGTKGGESKITGEGQMRRASRSNTAKDVMDPALTFAELDEAEMGVRRSRTTRKECLQETRDIPGGSEMG